MNEMTADELLRTYETLVASLDKTKGETRTEIERCIREIARILVIHGRNAYISMHGTIRECSFRP
jgi:hypothetical protein